MAKPFHRPFRKLRKLEGKRAPPQPPPDPAPEPPSGEFDAIAGASGVARAPQRGRVPGEPPEPVLRVPEVAPTTHAFSLRRDGPLIECHRDDEDETTVAWLGRCEPTAQLDLHGKDARAARSALRAFVRSRSRGGHRVVLVVTGKGRRSRQAVLREQAPEWLTELGELVRAFTTAPGSLGGAGALLVLLAQPGDKRR
jgi:DNA-nicking Smr family endonuclease